MSSDSLGTAVPNIKHGSMMLDNVYIYKGLSPKDGEKVLNPRNDLSEMERSIRAHVEAFKEKRTVIKG